MTIPFDAVTQPIVKTQIELDQEALEEQMRIQARKTLYHTHNPKDGLPEVNEYDMEEDVELRMLSKKGVREVDSEFLNRCLNRVSAEIKSQYHKLQLDSSDSQERSQPTTLAALDKVTNTIEYDVLALVGLANVLMGVQFGMTPVPPEHKITRTIATEIEFECFKTYIQSIDPSLLDYINRRSITDPTTRRNKKISGFIETVDDFYEVNWDWFDDSHLLRLGNFIRECVFSATGYFELMPVMGPNGHKQMAIVLTDLGVKVKKDILVSAQEKLAFNYPMIAPPRPFDSNGVGGGWYTSHAYPKNVLVRNCMGTQVSKQAIRAINDLASQPWEINQWIFNRLNFLLDKNIEIGSFRAFNEEMYDSVDNPLVQDPEDLRYDWKDENLTDEEKRRRNLAYYIQKQWESEKNLTKQKAVSPQRVVAIAQFMLDLRFEDRYYDKFYLPWFMDNRTRCYPQVDTLNCQGSDYQKALIQFRHGIPKSETSRRELLVSIATTYGNGIDKTSYDARAQWVEETLLEKIGDFTLMEKIIADPDSTVSMEHWTQADEPFQYLALCHEYVNVFIKKIWNEHRVSAGRDATCSGIQITGAMLRDQRTCSLVNVLPSPEPQDAYNDVAREARRLLTDKEWLIAAVDKNEKNRKRRADLWKAEFRELLAEGKRTEDQAPPEYQRRTVMDTAEGMKEWIGFIDRSVAKMPTMLIPYGGSFLTIYGHVKDKLKKKTDLIPNADFTIITRALIEGMAASLPAFSAVNQWFQSLAKAALDVPRDDGESPTIRWETPNGSKIVQEYHNPDTKSIRTFLGDSSTVRAYNSLKDDYDSLNTSKMRTALAANVVHSIDAAIIQSTVNHVTSRPDYSIRTIPFTAVHDCIYGPSGVISILQEAVRHSFYQSVAEDITEHIAFENLPNEQYRELLPKLTKGDAPVTLQNILLSDYLFS